MSHDEHPRKNYSSVTIASALVSRFLPHLSSVMISFDDKLMNSGRWPRMPWETVSRARATTEAYRNYLITRASNSAFSAPRTVITRDMTPSTPEGVITRGVAMLVPRGETI